MNTKSVDNQNIHTTAVDGRTLRTSNFQLIQDDVKAGYVMTADADGNATWGETALDTICAVDGFDEDVVQVSGSEGSYLFNGSTTADSSGNSRPLNVSGMNLVTDKDGRGTVAEYTASIVADLFPYASSYATFSNFAMSVWVWVPVGNTDAPALLESAGDASGILFIGLDHSAPEIFVEIQENVLGASVLLYQVPVTLADSSWHHLLFQFGSGGNQMYIDNVLQTPTYTNGSSATTASLDVVAPLDTLDQYGDSEGYFVDSMEFFNKILSPAERALLSTTPSETRIEFKPDGVNTRVIMNDTSTVIPNTLKYTGATPTAGYVLTTDVDGCASWQATSGGTVQSASNVGVGVGQVFKQLSGTDLQFKTILAGTNVTVTNDIDEIKIEATTAGSLVDGTSSVPSISWTNDPDTGFYRNSTSNEIIFVRNGIATAIFAPDCFKQDNRICSSEFEISDITFTPTTPLGTIFGAWVFDQNDVTIPAQNGQYPFDTNIGGWSRVVTQDGRTNVLLAPSGFASSLRLTDPTNIATMVIPTDTSIAFFIWPLSTNTFDTDIFTFSGATDTSDAIFCTYNASTNNLIFTFEQSNIVQKTSTLNGLLTEDAWNHVAFSFGISGWKIWVNSVNVATDLVFTQGLSSFPLLEFRFGARNSPKFPSTGSYFDSVVLLANTLDNTLVSGLATDLYTLTGVPSFAPQSKMIFDSGNTRSAIQLADNTNMITWDVTGPEVEVHEQLKIAKGIQYAFDSSASTNVVLSASSHFLELSSTSAVTVTLPNLTSAELGRVYTIIKTGASGTITINTFDGADFIDDNVTTSVNITTQFDKLQFVGNGVDRWYTL